MCGRNIEKMIGVVALAAVTLSLLMAISATPLALAQEGGEFSIQPRSFRVEGAPPSGGLYLVEEVKLRINNNDNIKRTFVLWVEAPDNLTPGYEPIPDNSWIVPIVPGNGQVIEIDENSWGLVDIYLNIPYQDNLRSKKWEALIVVKRQAEVGEVLEVELTCPAKIETSAELPPPPSQPSELPVAAIVALGVGISAVVLALAVWIRYGGKAKGRARGRVIS